MRPERAARTHRAFWVISTLFVRTSNHTIHHRDRLRLMRPNELQDLLKDGVFVSHVNLFGDSPPKCDWIFALGENDSDADLRRHFVVRPIERDRGYGISGKAAACFFPECYFVAFSQSHGPSPAVRFPCQLPPGISGGAQHRPLHAVVGQRALLHAVILSFYVSRPSPFHALHPESHFVLVETSKGSAPGFSIARTVVPLGLLSAMAAPNNDQQC